MCVYFTFRIKKILMIHVPWQVSTSFLGGGTTSIRGAGWPTELLSHGYIIFEICFGKFV